MTDFPGIINTEIINTESDVFWHNSSSASHITQTAEVLILSRSFEQNSPEQIQLNKILDACKLTAGQYNIVQLGENEKIAWHQLKTASQPGTVILFGIHPNDLGISALFRMNGPNSFDGCILIPTLSLQQLEQQPQAKKDLWTNALKPLIADKQ